MTLFATPQDLLNHVGTSVTALAQVATPDDHAVVSGELLRLTIEGGDRSAFEADEIEAADAALVNIVAAIERGDDVIISDIRQRYPAAETTLGGNDRLRGIDCDLAFYYLHGLRTDDDIVRRYKEARKDLADIRSGKILLDNSGAPDASLQSGEPIYEAPPTVFGRDDLKDY